LIPEPFVQELLARVDIVDVVGRYVQLRKGGVNLLGLCPFHNEKTPSFTVSPTKQFYHCFGCGAHGTALGFLMEHTGASFPEAVRTLAASVGMTVPETPRSPQQRAATQQYRAQTARQQQWLETAQAHYVTLLRGSPKAQHYLKRRGLDQATVERYGLGWSGSDSRGLARVFAHYEAPELLESGLVIDGQDGRRYDRFRERIMFPIHNAKGQLIGFGGRILDKGEPKYLNSPETPLFSKGRELYGLWEARQSIRTEGCVLVVEGYMDVVGLAQHGITHAVATLGTATTPEHIQKLLRSSERIVFSFDGDAAGRRAAWRALTTCLPLLRDTASIRFLFLPQGQDPDSYVQEFGQDALRNALSDAVPLSRFLLQELAARHPLDEAEGRAACVAEAQPLLAQLPHGTLRMQIERAFAKQVQLTPEELAHTLQRPPLRVQGAHIRDTPTARPTSGSARQTTPRSTANGNTRPAPRQASSAVTPLVKRLLRLLLAHPDLALGLDAAQLELLHHDPHLSLIGALMDVIRISKAQHTGALLGAIQTLNVATDLAQVVRSLSVEVLQEDALPDPKAEWQDALRRVALDAAKREQTALVDAGLHDAESRQRYETLTQRIKALQEETSP